MLACSITNKKKQSRWFKYQKIDVINLLDDSIPLHIIVELFSGVRFDIGDRKCWIRGNDSTVYTYIKYNDKRYGAHRLSLQLFTGKELINLGLHNCDRKACIRPDHIYDGTTLDNSVDRMMRTGGRKNWLANHLLEMEDIS